MTRYIDQLNENTAPVNGDYLLCYQASAGATDKDRKVNVSRFAVLANAQTFTAAQGFAPAITGANAALINMPASTTGYAIAIQYNSADRQQAQVSSTRNQYILSSFDNTTDIGALIQLGRNSNVSTPAAGFVYAVNRGGTGYAIWPDASGNLRIGTTLPTSAQDTSGTVVGAQTSALDSKTIIGETCSALEAMRSLRDAAANALRKFSYKSGAFNSESFDGLVIDYAPRYGMDRDQEHPAGKSLNMITLFNDLILAIDYLARRVEALEGAQ